MLKSLEFNGRGGVFLISCQHVTHWAEKNVAMDAIFSPYTNLSRNGSPVSG